MESNRIEYKRELTDGLEKEVIAFLNYHDGGLIYIGVDAAGDGGIPRLRNATHYQSLSTRSVHIFLPFHPRNLSDIPGGARP